METYSCVECNSPWFNRDDNPVVWETLNTMPIGFCDCEHPKYEPAHYNKDELTEVYYLATAPSNRTQNEVNILLDESDLQHLEWVYVKETTFFLTHKGRKLFPLLLLVASDLLKIGGSSGS